VTRAGRAREPDVIIVGAGVAGLHAADILARGGARVRVLEARDRVGGRVFTVYEPGWPAVEAGAEFVHGRPPTLMALLRRARLRPIEMQARHAIVEGGALRAANRLFEQASGLLEQLPAAGPDRSFAELSGGRWWRRLAPPPIQRMARDFIEGFNAAPAEAISVHSLARQTEASVATEGDRLSHVAGGYGRLVAALLDRAVAGGAEVRTGTCVRRIVWRAGQVEVSAQGALGRVLPTAAARAALVTLPLGVLKARPAAAGAVQFLPELPPEKRAAIRRLRVGPVVRAVLRFARPDVWSKRAGAFNFLHIPGAPFPTCWRANDVDQPPLVTAWAGGPPAAQLKPRTEPQRLREAVTSLARGLGTRAEALLEELVGWRVFDWQDDPFARGAYSYSPPGGLSLPEALGAEVAQTLFFAGEATHAGGHTGTVHGALATGAQAARAILAVK
jgi:monoamine oxidase